MLTMTERLLLILVVVYGGIFKGEVQAAAGNTGVPTIQLHCASNAKEYLLGEPVFIRLELQNHGTIEQSLRLHGGWRLRDSHWYLEVAKEGERFSRVELNRVQTEEVPVGGVLLAPGESLVDYIVLWFRAYGNTRKERALVFAEPGKYNYRITLVALPFQVPRDGSALKFVCKGTITVRLPDDRFRGACKNLTKGLKTILGDDSYVAYSKAEQLDKLIEQLSNTPYDIYVKWLRLRAFRTVGCDVLESGTMLKRGYEVDPESYKLLNGGKLNVDEEVRYVSRLADELQAAYETTPCVVLEDVLTVQGLFACYEQKREAAERILERMKKLFPYSVQTRRMKEWTEDLRAGRWRED